MLNRIRLVATVCFRCTPAHPDTTFDWKSIKHMENVDFRLIFFVFYGGWAYLNGQCHMLICR